MSLPGLGGGNRPGIGDGNRPGIGDGNRPGNRPGIGDGNRPGIGDGNRPGIGEGNRPGNLPGIGNGNIGIGNGNRPNIGNDINIGIGNGNNINIGNRPSTLPVRDRRDYLADRMRPGYGGRPGYGRPGYGRPGNGWGNWDRHYHHHHHWHHGPWHGGWHCGSRWNYWWDNYPVMTAFGVTTWAVNRVGWAFGYNSYSNPYYTTGSTVYVDNSVYDYSQPLVMTPEETTLGGDVSADPAGIPPESLSNFDQARQEFYAGNYEVALKSTDAALKELPNDAVIHEFRALTLFALGKYQDSAAVLYAVLSVGPGWDWTTMSGLYPDVDTYTAQLRSLETAVKSNPNDPAATLLLSYHYLTAGHDDAAKTQLSRLVRLTPNDPVAKQMLLNIDPDAEIPNPARQVQPPKPEANISSDKLQGAWTASRGDGKFTMELKDDGTFSWKFSQGDQSQEVTGVWNVDEEGVLAMEMNDGGVMLSQLVPKSSSQLDFYMLGDTQGSDPLSFSKG